MILAMQIALVFPLQPQQSKHIQHHKLFFDFCPLPSKLSANGGQCQHYSRKVTIRVLNGRMMAKVGMEWGDMWMSI